MSGALLINCAISSGRSPTPASDACTWSAVSLPAAVAAWIFCMSPRKSIVTGGAVVTAAVLAAEPVELGPFAGGGGGGGVGIAGAGDAGTAGIKGDETTGGDGTGGAAGAMWPNNAVTA